MADLEHYRAGVKRLEEVRATLRDLVRSHSWLLNAMRTAFPAFLDLCDKYETEELKLKRRRLELAKMYFKAGWPKGSRWGPGWFNLDIHAVCPRHLAERLAPMNGRGRWTELPVPEGESEPRYWLRTSGSVPGVSGVVIDCHWHSEPWPSKRQGTGNEREIQKAAWEALCDAIENALKFRASSRIDVFSPEENARVKAKTHVGCRWLVNVGASEETHEPANPHSLERCHLSRFSENDYRTIVLYRLGGLLDVGSARPIVPKPVRSDTRALLGHWHRLPITTADHDADNPPPSPSHLPPVRAEEMLDTLRNWVQVEDARRTKRNVSDRGAVKTADELADGEFQPANWFTKNSASWLRKAAAPGRKTKHVEKRVIDGVVMYRVSDVRRWRPKSLPQDKS